MTSLPPGLVPSGAKRVEGLLDFGPWPSARNDSEGKTMSFDLTPPRTGVRVLSMTQGQACHWEGSPCTTSPLGSVPPERPNSSRSPHAQALHIPEARQSLHNRWGGGGNSELRAQKKFVIRWHPIAYRADVSRGSTAIRASELHSDELNRNLKEVIELLLEDGEPDFESEFVG